MPGRWRGQVGSRWAYRLSCFRVKKVGCGRRRRCRWASRGDRSPCRGRDTQGQARSETESPLPALAWSENEPPALARSKTGPLALFFLLLLLALLHTIAYLYYKDDKTHYTFIMHTRINKHTCLLYTIPSIMLIITTTPQEHRQQTSYISTLCSSGITWPGPFSPEQFTTLSGLSLHN